MAAQDRYPNRHRSRPQTSAGRSDRRGSSRGRLRGKAPRRRRPAAAGACNPVDTRSRDPDGARGRGRRRSRGRAALRDDRHERSSPNAPGPEEDPGPLSGEQTMKNSGFDCAGVRARSRAGRLGRHDESHLFGCAECRLEARIAAAWKTLPRPESLEDASPVEESFVRRVLISVRADRRRQTAIAHRPGRRGGRSLLLRRGRQSACRCGARDERRGHLLAAAHSQSRFVPAGVNVASAALRFAPAPAA